MILFSFILTLALTHMHTGLSAVPQAKAADAVNLDTVLKKMDTAAASFRSVQADFEWDTYEKVIDEVDEIQTGTVYYRRNGKDIEMMAEVKKVVSDPSKLKPEPKFVLFKTARSPCISPRPTK